MKGEGHSRVYLRNIWTPPKTLWANRPLTDSLGCVRRDADLADRSPGLFDVDARLAEISAKGDGLERVAALVDFEVSLGPMNFEKTRAVEKKQLAAEERNAT